MAAPTLTFRQAEASDVRTVQSLVRSAYRGESSRQGWTTEADIIADDRIDEAGVLAKINDPDCVIFLAYNSNNNNNPTTAVACCEIVRQKPGLAYFGLFAVDPAQQSGGIGRQVLEHAEGFARDGWGCAAMEMQVLWMREALIAWYERRGYVKTGDTRPFLDSYILNGEKLRDDLYFQLMVKKL